MLIQVDKWDYFKNPSHKLEKSFCLERAHFLRFGLIEYQCERATQDNVFLLICQAAQWDQIAKIRQEWNSKKLWNWGVLLNYVCNSLIHFPDEAHAMTLNGNYVKSAETCMEKIKSSWNLLSVPISATLGRIFGKIRAIDSSMAVKCYHHRFKWIYFWRILAIQNHCGSASWPASYIRGRLINDILLFFDVRPDFLKNKFIFGGFQPYETSVGRPVGRPRISEADW